MPSSPSDMVPDPSDTSTAPKIRYTDTLSAYEAWSDVYDTDGNFLQALDTLEMKVLLPELLSMIESTKPWRFVDLGCGTGRNTMALLNLSDVQVTALDLSPKMLGIAKRRLEEESHRLARTSQLNLAVFDMLSTVKVPLEAQDADVVVSTLVVEHIPLDAYFGTAAKMLKTGGLLLVTNMHPDMGQISQAGFFDPVSGEKIRPTSYLHTIDETVLEAGRHGFEVVKPFVERAVDAKLVPKLGWRANKWVGVTCWFGGILRKTL